MLSASLRRYEDPARSADPRIRQLVAQLATLEPTPAPRAHFRAELRAQLVAVAPRLVAEGAAIETPRPVRQAAKPAHAAKRTHPRLRAVFGRNPEVSLARPLGVLTAVVALFAVLLGGAVWASKKALPGESLYALKRANENAQLAFATGDTAKGRDYLAFAKTRAEEVSALLKRSSSTAADGSGPSAAGGVNADTAKLVTSTLGAADKELSSGAQLLGGQAVRSGSDHPLEIMTAWAPGQVARLQRIADRLPAGSLRNRAETSTQLAAAAYSRAKALRPVVDCQCVTKSTTDQLGPVPCTGCTTPKLPGQSAVPSTGTGSSAGNRPAPNATSTGATSAGNGSASAPGQTGAGSSSDESGVLPPLPVPLPSLPVPPTTSADNGSDGATPEPTCTINVLGFCLPL